MATLAGNLSFAFVRLNTDRGRKTAEAVSSPRSGEDDGRKEKIQTDRKHLHRTFLIWIKPLRGLVEGGGYGGLLSGEGDEGEGG